MQDHDVFVLMLTEDGKSVLPISNGYDQQTYHYDWTAEVVD